jgi:O-antigen ligase
MRVWLRGVLFPLSLLAFAAVGVHYLQLVFNTSTRWIFLILLIMSLLPRGELFMAYRSRSAPILLAYLLWCFVTAIWSAVPLLSLLKAAAFVIVTTTFIGAGQVWSERQFRSAPIMFLAAITGLASYAAFFAPGGKASVVTGTGITIYQGLAGNPNYLGILVAIGMAVPLYLATVYRDRQNQTMQIFWWAVVAIFGYLLWRTGSRSSIICALTMIAIYAAVMNRGRRAALVFAAVVAIVAVSVAAPEIEQGVYQRVVVKSARGNDAFFSRRLTWQESERGAAQGGLTGLGYGVSAGYTKFDFSLTSNNYGREKGNAQLAIWEETGIIGLSLYAVFLITLFAELIVGFANAKSVESRAESAILIGVIAGLVFQSVFEAWWTSPGSIESSIFWSTVGVAIGKVRAGVTVTAESQMMDIVAHRPISWIAQPGTAGFRLSAPHQPYKLLDVSKPGHW